MAGDEIIITVPGNLTADPELRFTGNGVPVANFIVASTPRTYDRQSNQWRDEETTFLKCTAWRDTAENVAETLTKGAAVIVSGKLITRKFKTREGEDRTAHEIDVDNVGPSLRYASAQVSRNARKNSNGQQGGGQPQNGQQGGGWGNTQQPSQSANDDPWAAAGSVDDDPWA